MGHVFRNLLADCRSWWASLNTRDLHEPKSGFTNAGQQITSASLRENGMLYPGQISRVIRFRMTRNKFA